MKLQQLSLFIENRPGHLGAPLEALAAEGINLVTLSLADTAQFGILRLIVRDWQRAKQVLERAGWVVNLTEVVAVDVVDRPGGLAEILKVLEGKSVLVLRFEDPDRAIQVLDAAGLRGSAAEELFSNLPEPTFAE